MKKIILLIIVFFPFLLPAQKLIKKNPDKDNNVVTKKTLKKNTYAGDQIRLAKLTKPIYDEIQSNNKLMRSRYNLLNVLSDSSARSLVKKGIDSLFTINEKLESQLTLAQFNFVRNNPSSFLSLDGLSTILENNTQLPLDDTIESLFNELDENIQHSATGRKFKLMLEKKKKSQVGSLAPDFKVRDINNKEMSLSDFRNKKIVLLDFWASWCKPCREDMPFLKRIFKTYNGKGLEIIGISKDDNLSLWKKAIIQDSIAIWRHISVPLNIQPTDSSAITNKFFVYGIPVKILINKKGEIIGRWTGSGEENIEQLKKLLKKTFDED